MFSSFQSSVGNDRRRAAFRFVDAAQVILELWI